MARQRIEDIGRIMVLIEKIMNNELFEHPFINRPKGFAEWFNALSHEKRLEFLSELPYKLRSIYEEVCDISCICSGHDYLNEDK